MSNLSFTSSHASRILNVVRGGLKPAGIDPHVTRSWYRCMKEYGIEPSAKRESAVLDPQTVREAQHRMGELLRVARAEMESLYDQIAGSGFAVILSDMQGAVMSTITDPDLATRIPPGRTLARRDVGRKTRRHQRHRHVPRRRMFGDGASRRTLSRLQHRARRVPARRSWMRTVRCSRCSTHHR